jgi:hypothetical protein
MTIDPFTHRVQILSSTFSGADEDACASVRRSTSFAAALAEERPRRRASTACRSRWPVVTAPCDADGAKRRLLFPVGLCFNVADPTC